MQVVEQLKRMDGERFRAIYESLAQNGFGPLDGEVAKALKFRPQAIRKLPMDQRARRAKRLLESGAMADLTYELFGSYLLKNHRELVTGFLDATGVEHDDGMLEGGIDENRPAAEKIEPAVRELDGKHDPADVTLYLSICAEQWPGVAELQELWKTRSRE